MVDRETLQLVAALADVSKRKEAAASLAAHLGAEALLVFVEDAEVAELVPAPGIAQTFAGGPAWRRLLAQCRDPGAYTAEVPYPTAGRLVSAKACSAGVVALVFLGGNCDGARLSLIALLLPLLGSALGAEHAVAVAAGELAVARADARHAAALARSLDTARADLERQAISLSEARRRAEQATRAKDEFMAMLGHELRNPLAPIVTALQIMRLRGMASSEQDVVERQVGQLVRLVDDLLDVSRIATGKIELRQQRIELAPVVMRSVEAVSPLFELKRQTLALDVAESGLAVHADPDRLAQVFTNLLANAAKYSDSGTRIEIVAKLRDGMVGVSIKDQGVGIETDMLESVFESFVQQQQSIDRSRGGLGLGLAIVKNIVTLHGGTVRAKSEGPGTGSEFVVELPLSTEQISEPEVGARVTPVHDASRGPHPPSRVLVVDDNQDAAELLVLALSNLGYDVRSAFDAPSALQVAHEFLPQIAVLDIGLPVMDGYELARRLRYAAPGTPLHLVALTGYGQASDRERSREAGFDAHLVKPVDLSQLQHLFDQLATSPQP